MLKSSNVELAGRRAIFSPAQLPQLYRLTSDELYWRKFIIIVKQRTYFKPGDLDKDGVIVRHVLRKFARKFSSYIICLRTKLRKKDTKVMFSVGIGIQQKIL